MRILALTLSLFLLTPLAQACSINAAGSCGGSACTAGKTCTKTDDVTCKCVKNKSAGKKHKAAKSDKSAEKSAEKPAENSSADKK